MGEFRNRLRGTLNASRGVYEISLNTLVLSRDLNLRENQGASFVGPTYDNVGQVLTAGRYLDKIDWIKFHVLDRTLASPQTREANFSYGGITYARTECSRLLNSQAQAPGELVSFPFRFFRPGSGRTWSSQMNQEANVQLTFSAVAGEPTGGENSFWRERSLAATRWTLEVAQDRLNPDSADDLVIYVHHNAALRQKCLERTIPVGNVRTKEQREASTRHSLSNVEDSLSFGLACRWLPADDAA